MLYSSSPAGISKRVSCYSLVPGYFKEQDSPFKDFFHHINLTTVLIVSFNYLFIFVSFCSTCCLQVGCESNMTKNGSKNGKRSCLLPMVHYQEQWGLSSFAFGSLLFRNNLRVLKEDFDIYCLVLAGLDKGDKVACDKARKLFVIYCATTVSESVFVCLKCIS